MPPQTGGLTSARPRRPHQSPREMFTFVQCALCGAMRDDSERSLCCMNGSCVLASTAFPDHSDAFKELCESTQDLSDISRALNNRLAFASIGSDYDRDRIRTPWEYRQVTATGGSAPCMYALNGRTYHAFHGDDHNSSHFYMFPDGYSAQQEKLSPYLDRDVVVKFREFLFVHSPLAKAYVYAADDPAIEELHVLLRADVREPFVLLGNDVSLNHPCRVCYLAFPRQGPPVYLSPVDRVSEVATYPLFYPLGEGGWYAHWDCMSKRYVYPLFHDGKPINTVLKYVKYASYQFSPFFCVFSSLYQQWILDQFSRWQEQTFDFMANNENIVSALKHRLVKFKDADVTKTNKYGKVGRPFLLPASVPGSPAAHRLNARNSMAVVIQLGGPTHWVTFTMDPHCDEFYANARALVPASVPDAHITPENYPWIVGRIYRRQRKDFLADLRKGDTVTSPFATCDPHCGRPIYIQLVDEFQKRFWPHFHLLCRLSHAGIWTMDQVDAHISARLFYYEHCPLTDSHMSEHDVKTNKVCQCTAHLLYKLVKAKHVHTCKPGRCMICKYHLKNVRTGHCVDCARAPCGKYFPKEKTTRTYCDIRGWFHYCRPRDEDLFVVPYMPAWTLRYKNHINGEMATGMHTVEYVHSYQNKGHDFTDVAVDTVMANTWIEFHNFQCMRHVGFMEAYLRLMSMNLMLSFPTCTPLYIHLEGEHTACVSDKMSPEQIAMKKACSESPLLRYFWRNPLLSSLKYRQYYDQFTLSGTKTDIHTNLRRTAEEIDDDAEIPVEIDDSSHQQNIFIDVPPSSLIKPKKAKRRSTLHVTRIEFPSQYNVEKYCLGLILENLPVTSFDECRTFNGKVFNTITECAYARGYFSEHDEFERTLMEMIQPFEIWESLPVGQRHPMTMRKPSALRRTFVAMAFSGASAVVLFDRFWFYMSLDLPHERSHSRTEPLEDDLLKDYLLRDLQDILFANRSSLADIGLPEPSERLGRDEILMRERARYSLALNTEWHNHAESLNVMQRAAYMEVVGEIMCAQTRSTSTPIRYVNAAAGTGKTFLCNCIAGSLRLSGKIVLACAPSARASQNHPGGMTFHKCFDCPIGDPFEVITSQLSYMKHHGVVVAHADLLIIDELPMLSQNLLSALDVMLRELMNVNLPFGGKNILACGDFQQLPPVVPKGGRAAVIASSVISHPTWPLWKKLTLHDQMRLTDRVYLDWSVALGKGDISPDQHDLFTSLDLPPDVTIQPDISEAMKLYCASHDFPDNLRTLHCVKQLSKTRLFQSFCCANRNTEVIEHNHHISAFVQAFYKNSDVFTCIAQEELCKSSADHASSILATPQTMAADTSHNIPYHELHLFRGCKVMLMRNILLSRGCANGNQFIVLNCGRHFVEAMNITAGEHFGNVEWFFRIRVTITLKSQFSYTRLQFPLRVSFANTTHKFQGDTLPSNAKLLADVRLPPFCHGQAFVLFTRAQRANQVIVVNETSYPTTISGMAFHELVHWDDEHVTHPPSIPEFDIPDFEDFSYQDMDADLCPHELYPPDMAYSNHLSEDDIALDSFWLTSEADVQKRFRDEN